jgi:hypothetical protein
MKRCEYDPCGLYYNPITIINDDSRVINKLETSLTDDARVSIYNHNMFIVQATDVCKQNNHLRVRVVHLKPSLFA